MKNIVLVLFIFAAFTSCKNGSNGSGSYSLFYLDSFWKADAAVFQNKFEGKVIEVTDVFLYSCSSDQNDQGIAQKKLYCGGIDPRQVSSDEIEIEKKYVQQGAKKDFILINGNTFYVGWNLRSKLYFGANLEECYVHYHIYLKDPGEIGNKEHSDNTFGSNGLYYVNPNDVIKITGQVHTKDGFEIVEAHINK